MGKRKWYGRRSSFYGYGRRGYKRYRSSGGNSTYSVPPGNSYFGRKGLLGSAYSGVVTDTTPLTSGVVPTNGNQYNLLDGSPHTIYTKLRIWQIRVKWSCWASPVTAGDCGIGLRIILGNSRQNNGEPSVQTNELLFNGGLASNNYQALINQDFCPEKYKVWRDRSVTLTPVANTRAAPGLTVFDSPTKTGSMMVKFKKGLPVLFTGNSGTNNDITTNAPFLTVYAQNGNRATFSGTCSVTYSYA
jgi:hypothetical protein